MEASSGWVKAGDIGEGDGGRGVAKSVVVGGAILVRGDGGGVGDGGRDELTRAVAFLLEILYLLLLGLRDPRNPRVFPPEVIVVILRTDGDTFLVDLSLAVVLELGELACRETLLLLLLLLLLVGFDFGSV